MRTERHQSRPKHRVCALYVSLVFGPSNAMLLDRFALLIGWAGVSHFRLLHPRAVIKRCVIAASNLDLRVGLCCP